MIFLLSKFNAHYGESDSKYNGVYTTFVRHLIFRCDIWFFAACVSGEISLWRTYNVAHYGTFQIIVAPT